MEELVAAKNNSFWLSAHEDDSVLVLVRGLSTGEVGSVSSFCDGGFFFFLDTVPNMVHPKKKKNYFPRIN